MRTSSLPANLKPLPRSPVIRSLGRNSPSKSPATVCCRTRTKMHQPALAAKHRLLQIRVRETEKHLRRQAPVPERDLAHPSRRLTLLITIAGTFSVVSGRFYWRGCGARPTRAIPPHPPPAPTAAHPIRESLVTAHKKQR